MKVFINTSTSAMTFPCGGQDFPLIPRKQAHPSQSSNVFAIVYDPEALDQNTKDFIERNVRRRYCAIDTPLTLEGLRPGQVFVIRKTSAARLDVGPGHLTATLTMAAVQERIPELFPTGELPVAEPAPSPESLGHRTTPKKTRTAYVARDGGHFQVPWNQIKPGDTLMIREDDGTYVKDAETGEQEFAATSAPYVVAGVWTVDTVPLSKKPAETPVNGTGETVIDTKSAGATGGEGGGASEESDDDSDDDSDDSGDAEGSDDDDDESEEDAEDDDSDDASEEGQSTTPAETGKGLSDVKPPPVGGVAGKGRRSKSKTKRNKGQGRPAATGKGSKK